MAGEVNDLLFNVDDPEQALRQQMAPRPPRGRREAGALAGALLGSEVQGIFEEGRASAELARDTPIQDPDPEGLSILGNLAVSLGIGFATAGSSIPVQVGAQVIGALGTETASGLLQGAGLEAAARQGLGEAAVAGGAEALVAGVVPAAGGIVRLGRHGFRQVAGRVRSTVGRDLPVQPGRNTLSAPNRSRLIPGALAAQATAENLNIVIPPGNLVQQRAVDLIQNIADSAIIGGGRLEALQIGGERAAESAIGAVVNRFPKMSRQETAKLVQDLASGQLAEVKGVAQGLFKQADELIGTTPVDVRQLKREAEGIVRQQQLGLLPADSRIGAIVDLPDSVGFQQAQQIRSDLFDISKQFDVGAGVTVSRDKAAATRLSASMTRSIREAAGKAGPEARQVLDRANKVWRSEVKGTFTNQLVAKVLAEQPADMLDAIITTRGPGDITAMRKIVTRADPTGNAWRSVQGRLLERITQASGEQLILPGGQASRGVVRVDGKKLVDEIQAIGGTDDAALRAFFPGQDMEAINNLREYGNVIRFVQKRVSPSNRNEGIFFNMLQAGAIGGVLFSLNGDTGEAVTVGGASILLGPLALQRLLTNRNSAKWLSVGATSTPGSRTAARAILNTVGHLWAEGLLEGESAKAAEQHVRAAQQTLGGGVRVETSSQLRDAAARRILERAQSRTLRETELERATEK